ncbi:MAG TPA: LysE/ArgO family amino acid transporter [Burkholderiaceae bacterium]
MNVAFLKGLGMGAGLIMAIGAQNAFVLRQGLLKRYVFICALICSLCDMVLISAGVAGMGSLIMAHPALLVLAKWGGALFLAYYGLRSAIAAFKAGGLAASSQSASGYGTAIAMAFSFSLLNPHVYLDTVVLLGAIGGQQPDGGRVEFALGAMSASVLWFFGLAYGARLLAPLFARPVAWRVLDGLIAVVMWGLAASLLV